MRWAEAVRFAGGKTDVFFYVEGSRIPAGDVEGGGVEVDAPVFEVVGPS